MELLIHPTSTERKLVVETHTHEPRSRPVNLQQPQGNEKGNGKSEPGLTRKDFLLAWDFDRLYRGEIEKDL